ncbi:hypothetical protein LTR36_007542 [Oleoguttula mirabilis]|uniref:Translation initiation factor IF-2, mitochondrial n=1 Tax=Oleoguttula mirabilis TaxID=1507867 RepID=A0AAV9JUE5_9PEZI|nr:hypothetical protein LTR36_007542 [Oleoguttula mirabilis]
MRRQRVLRTTSSLCLICACRLTADLPSVLTPAAPFFQPRRQITTTRAPKQSASPATAEAPNNGTPSAGAFDPNSSLTRSEQLEKAALRDRRAAREREAQEAADAQRRQQEAAARAVAEQRRGERDAREAVQRGEQAKVAEQWRQEQEIAQAEAAKRGAAAAVEAKREAESQRLLRNRPKGEGNVYRTTGGDGVRRTTGEDGRVKEPNKGGSGSGEAAEGPSRIRSIGGGPRSAFSRVPRDDGSEAPRTAGQGGRDGRRESQQRFDGRQDMSRGQSAQQQKRHDDPFAPTRQASRPQRVAMPAFGGGASPGHEQEQDLRPKESGWGARAVERAPLKYGEERPNANITEATETYGQRFVAAQGGNGGDAHRRAHDDEQETRQQHSLTRRPSADNALHTAFGGASGGGEPQQQQQQQRWPSQPQQQRLSRDPLAFSERSPSAGAPRAYGPSSQYQYRFRPEAARAEERGPPPPFSEQGRDGSGRPVAAAVRDGQDSNGWPAAAAAKENRGWGSEEAQSQSQSLASLRSRPGGDEWGSSRRAPLSQHDDGQQDLQSSRALADYGLGGQRQAQQQQRGTPQQEQSVPYRPQPRQSAQSTDSIGSYQPPPPPPPPPRQRDERDERSTGYNNSGYQATMFDAQDYDQQQQQQKMQSGFDEEQAANWQHLRRRNSAPPPPSSAAAPAQRDQQQHYYPPHQQQQQQSSPRGDEAWIDRQFQAHLQQRPQPPSVSSTSSFPSPFDPEFTDAQAPEFDRRRTVASQRCGRCGEAGHVARECEGPVRTKCNVCGQAGHYAYDCPRNERSKAYRKEQQEAGRYQRGGLDGDAFAGRAAPSGGFGGGDRSGMARRTQSAGPSAFGEMRQSEEASDAFSDRGHARRKFDPEREGGLNGDLRDRTPRRQRFDEGEKEDALSDVRDRVLQRPGAAESAPQNDVEEGDEQPAERVLRSRKFADDAPAKKEKSGRPGRRRGEDEEEDDESGAARDERNMRKAARKADKEKVQSDKQAKAAERKARQVEARSQVKLPEFVSVATLAQTLGVRYENFVARLERLGYDDVFPGKVLNAETSGMIAMEYDFEPVFESTSPEADERDLKARPEVEDKEFLPTRPPVVTIMGHVDHGKTTILDYLRKSSVAAGEAGGITQHIGAFSVPLASSGKTITFLDTPGHAAFLAMRQRGAHVTDIVILVVAADDSVKPQTLEAIKHARAAGVPMIVAVNKMDREEADLQRVKQDLARHGVEIEDFGGETQVVPVSGKTGEGMEALEESVVTLSEILDQRAEMDGLVEGWVLEATTKKAGRVATVLVRRGTLRVGAVIVAGKTWARVRTLRNEAGQAVREVGPGMPVEVDGWRDQPAAGDEVLQAGSEQKAGDVVAFRVEREEREKTAQDMEAINEARRVEQAKREREKLAERAKKAGDVAYFEAAARADEAAAAEEQQTTGQMSVPFIIKADVSGSAEAVSAYILSVASPLIAPRILRSQVGGINESDVELAAAAQGHIISFNLPADEGMKGQAEARGVKVLENNIIYRVLDDVKAVLEAKLPPVVTQRVLGEAEVGAAFEIGVGGRKTVKIAGCKVRNGVVGRGGRVRVLRGSEKVYDGTIDSLKNVKKDVQEMRKGTECGMGFEGWDGFEVGDQIQTYEEVSERRRL